MLPERGILLDTLIDHDFVKSPFEFSKLSGVSIESAK